MCVIIFYMDIYVHCIYVHGSMERKNMFFSIIYNYNIYHLIFLSYISDIKLKKKRKKKNGMLCRGLVVCLLDTKYTLWKLIQPFDDLLTFRLQLECMILRVVFYCSFCINIYVYSMRRHVDSTAEIIARCLGLMSL